MPAARAHEELEPDEALELARRVLKIELHVVW